MKKLPTSSHPQEVVSPKASTQNQQGPRLNWTRKFNEQSGKYESLKLELSDGTSINETRLKKAFKELTGSDDLQVGERILSKISGGFSEEEQTTRLEALTKNRTTLVIAHRLSTVKNAGRILVLTDKGVSEQGTHEELIAMQGAYANLYHTQLKM